MAGNIVHLVLARLPDAPEGVKGISLFVVPKFLVGEDGAPGARNDVRCVSIEHKLGIHASPTCTLAFGDDGGATGWLVGEPHKGLEYMFAMMNNARLGVGLQGIGIAEHAGQAAAAYAAERRQGGAEIVEHPDVRRMLGLIKSRVMAARVLACRAAAALDVAHRDGNAQTRARAQRRVDLLIPVVKGWSTETGIHSASLGVQVHGGMGYVEETGAAQHLRDARITTIYEGTTGIQALDLVGRKLLRDRGEAMAELVADMRASADVIADAPGDAVDWAAMQAMTVEAADIIETASRWMLERNDLAETRAGANAMLELFGICAGAWAMAEGAAAAAARIAGGESGAHLNARLRMADFYRTQVFPQARAASAAVTDGARSVLRLSREDLGIAV